MKNFRAYILQKQSFWLVIIGVIMSCGNSKNEPGEQTSGESVFKKIDVYEANVLLERNLRNKDFVVIDVRSEGEFAVYHLNEAINLDVNRPDFNDAVSRLDKKKTFMLYCDNEERSTEAFDIMKDMGFTHIYLIIGGIVQ